MQFEFRWAKSQTMIESWKECVRQALKDRGMTMKAASRAAGKGETFVRDMLERGRSPSVDSFISLSRSIGIPVSVLLGEEAPPIRTTGEILAFLHRIEGLNERGVELAMMAIETARQASLTPTPEQTAAGDQSVPANRPHASEPSR